MRPGAHRGPRRRPAGVARPAGTRVLVTAFGPFPGVPDNPSAAVARRLHDVGGARLVRRQFATEWAGLDRLDALIAAIRPGLAVHLGVAPGAARLRIETSASSADALAVDAAGRLPAVVADADGRPATRRVRVAAARLAAAARLTGVPAAVSGDAGRYLCNAMLYRSLALATVSPRPHVAVFVHLPPPAPIPGRRLDDLVVAVEAVIAALVRMRRPPRPRQAKSLSRTA